MVSFYDVYKVHKSCTMKSRSSTTTDATQHAEHFPVAGYFRLYSSYLLRAIRKRLESLTGTSQGVIS